MPTGVAGHSGSYGFAATRPFTALWQLDFTRRSCRPAPLAFGRFVPVTMAGNSAFLVVPAGG